MPEAPDEPQSAPDKRRFHIQRCLGSGGFGEVYLALMTSAGGLRSEVAVKVLHGGIDPSFQALARLRDEGRMLALLKHPAILRAIDLVVLDGQIALVTEYQPGDDLAGLLAGRNRMPLRPLVEVIGLVADALHSAYYAQTPEGAPLRLVHRDVKPANIRVGPHGEVKLLDFGIARAANVDREAKTRGGLVGSFAYMAPERFDGEQENGPMGDVFSLGCILYEALGTGRFFEDMDLAKQAALCVDLGRYEGFLSKRIRDLLDAPRAAVDLVRETLASDPSERPSARALARSCDTLADALPGPSLRRWCQERAWSEPPRTCGALDGRVLTESSLTAHSADTREGLAALPAPTESPGATSDVYEVSTTQKLGVRGQRKQGRRPMWPWLTLALLAGGFTLAMVLAAGAAGSLAMFQGRKASAISQDEPIATTPPKTVDTGTQEEPDVQAIPAEVLRPASLPTHAAPVVPSPPASLPPPSEPPAVVPANQGILVVDGSTLAQLRDATGAYGPGEVPPGSYAIVADFGDGPSVRGSVTIEAGRTTTVRCNRLRQTCEASVR